MIFKVFFCKHNSLHTLWNIKQTVLHFLNNMLEFQVSGTIKHFSDKCHAVHLPESYNSPSALWLSVLFW